MLLCQKTYIFLLNVVTDSKIMTVSTKVITKKQKQGKQECVFKTNKRRNGTKIMITNNNNPKKMASATERIIQINSIYLPNNLKSYDEKLIIQGQMNTLCFHEKSQGYIRVDYKCSVAFSRAGILYGKNYFKTHITLACKFTQSDLQLDTFNSHSVIHYHFFKCSSHFLYDFQILGGLVGLKSFNPHTKILWFGFFPHTHLGFFF